jgi:hypothetical protein
MADSEILRAQTRIYRQSFLEHGDSPRATHNTGRDVQYLRFERIMLHLLPLRTAFSIHDVGAGLCDLHGYLLDRDVDHVYTATEVVPEMVEASRRKYPDITVHNRDLLAEEPSDRHDFVVLSGVFNIPGSVERGAWREFVLGMVDRMYRMAGVAVAFNFLTTYRTFTDPDLCYMDPAEMLDHCMRRLSRFVILDHAYPLFECTMTVLRPEFVERQYGRSTFAKYFAVTRIEP